MSLDRRASDAGFTLVEMIVAAAVFSLVALTVMGVLLTTITTEVKIRNVSLATSQAQLVTRSLNDGISNAATPQRLIVPASTADQLLMARVAGEAASLGWSCQAWYFSATEGTIRTTSSSTAIATPTASQLATWTLLASGVRPLDGATTVFSPVGATGVSMAFRIDAGEFDDVVLKSTYTSSSRVTGGAPCY